MALVHFNQLHACRSMDRHALATQCPNHHHHHHHLAGAMDGARVAGTSMRRRERRLRSWAKHERMTVAMALAENLHHSRQKVEGDEHDGPRAQKTARVTGARPGVLTEPQPQGGGSHGRLRGCPGASPGGGVTGWRRRG